MLTPEESPDQQILLQQYRIVHRSGISIDGGRASTDRVNILPAGLPGIEWIR